MKRLSKEEKERIVQRCISGESVTSTAVTDISLLRR